VEQHNIYRIRFSSIQKSLTALSAPASLKIIQPLSAAEPEPHHFGGAEAVRDSAPALKQMFTYIDCLKKCNKILIFYAFLFIYINFQSLKVIEINSFNSYINYCAFAKSWFTT
jgi:hypothetical protein